MWKCHKCRKPVFFAERKQSLGYDWHPECLRCEECGKRLNPGQHAEHKGVPYCHVPCYGALFGPQLFGHGTRVESHKSFGQHPKGTPRSPAGPALPRAHLESKLKVYNQFYDSKSLEIRCREVNGRLVLEGAIRIHWGVQGLIHLKEDDDQRTVVTVRKRNSCRYRNSAEIQDLSDKESNEVDPPTDSMSSSIIDNDNNDTTISDSISYDTLSISSDFNSIDSKSDSNSSSKEVSPSHKYVTLPPKLEVKKLHWDEIDDLLQVERKVDETEKLYQTMPSPMTSSLSHSLTSADGDADKSEITESLTETSYKTLTPHSNSTDTPINGSTTDEDYNTPTGTLKPSDYDDFKKQMSEDYINGTNDLKTNSEGTLKFNQPIDPNRINDSLKLYNDSVMNKSLSDEQCRNIFSLPVNCNITDSFHYEEDATLKHPGNIFRKMENWPKPTNYHLQKSESASITSPTLTTDEDSWTADRVLLRSKSHATHFSGNSFIDSDDEGTETLKPYGRPQTSIQIKMDCYDEPNPNAHKNGNDSSEYSVSVSNYHVTEDGVVLRKAHKTGSTAIKRRSGNRRSRTKLKRRCSINGHFYNRETSFFTPPHGSQMSVWVTSLVNTQEVINLLLEKYKVESRPDNFALFVMKDNGEQKKLKEDDYPLISRIMLGPHEDICKLYLMDGQVTPEISCEVAQFLNLSVPECRAILERYHEEEERELYRIREKYSELRKRITQRMESLKVRL